MMMVQVILQMMISSNRTFMELKFTIGLLVPFNFDSSNRTFMELKFGNGTAIIFVHVVLIVPLWN